MKKGIHPEIFEITVKCVCGNSFKTTSTEKEITTDICAACHPFFTGTQKFIDTAGRIERFQQRYQKKAEKAKEKAAPKKTLVSKTATPKKTPASKTTESK